VSAGGDPVSAAEPSFHVLGRVRAERDGVEVPLAGTQRRALLSLLVVNLNRVVGVQSVAEALWPEQHPASVSASIHVAVSGLRAALAAAGPRDDAVVIERVGLGYRLTAPASHSDLTRFTASRDAGLRELGRGRPAEAASHLRVALAQWSGRALEGVIGLGLDDLATALEDERLDALETRLEADLRLGNHSAVVGELAALVHEVPLRESIWAKHMLALYRCGRQAEALEAYARLRSLLHRELGIEPEPAVVTLHGRLLRHDPALDLDPGPDELVAAATERGDISLPAAELLGPDGQAYPVHDGLSLGRAPSSTIVIDDPRVSRSHAVIRATATGFVLADLRSTNGTYVDGALLIEPRALRDGDTIRVSTRDFVFHQEEATSLVGT
jgi:DNA-binding SARP family transcriptional activator